MSDQDSTTAQAPPEAEPPRQDKGVVVRYGRMGHVGLFEHDLEGPLAPRSVLVARTDRGTELGKVLINVSSAPGPWCLPSEALEGYLQACGQDYPFTRGGRVLRRATAQDLNDQQHLDGSSREEGIFCREQIGQLNLPMRLVTVEHLLGGERIVFYFISEQRVDFRELVRRLAGRYHTRIEMRQVGARDEARLVADFERCGRRCCCQQYLKFLKPVSMKMAKVQKATLDPSKISGRCGRLMCCLRYEDLTYDELQGRLPKKNTWVRTAEGVVGKVLDAQILTQLVRLMLPDATQRVVPGEEIVERGLAPPAAPAERARSAAEPPRPPRQRVLLRDTIQPPDQDEAGGEEPPEPAAQAPQGGSAPAPAQSGAPDGQRPVRKHRRRRRKNRRPGGQAPSGGNQPGAGGPPTASP